MPNEGYGKLTFGVAISLAAPHTWVASLVPVLLGFSLCAAGGSTPSLVTTLAALLGADRKSVV